MDYDVPLRRLARIWVPLPGIDLRIINAIADALATTGHVSLGTQIGVREQGFLAKPGLSTDSGWHVLVGETVDVAWTPRTAKTTDIGIEEFVRVASAVFSNVLIDGMLTSRIAVVQEGLLPEQPPAAMTALAHKLLALPEGLPEPFEWDWRIATHVPRGFGGAEHQTNTVITIKRFAGTFVGVGESAAFDRIQVNLDLNSLEESAALFTKAQVLSFLTSAAGWHRETAAIAQAHMG